MSKLLVVADILGYIGIILLYIQVVFGSRHIFRFFTTDTVAVNKLHASIGKYSILAILLHPIITMMHRLESFTWIVTPNFFVESEKHISMGRFALLLFLAVWITSALVREKIKWHPWKWIHLLSYPIVILSFFHLKDLGTFYREYMLIQILWVFFFVLLICSILMRLYIWTGGGKQKYTLVEKKLVGTDIVLVKLKPLKKDISSKIGQHFFLQAGAFKSEHPFTIIRNVGGVLEFGIRKVGKFWNQIEGLEIGKNINVDGPYGVFTLEAQNTSPKIIISAGIGVTPFVDLIDKYGQNAVYMNCNRKIEEAVERELLKSKSTRYIDIVNEYSGPADPNIKVGMISEKMITDIVGKDHQTTPVFVCGSPRFIKAVKKIFIALGTPKKNVYYEELGF
jgi:predicted ferric reductase